MRNPLFNKGSFRVVRGGFWNDYPNNLRSAKRLINTPTDRLYSLGFRLFRSKEKQ